MARVEGEGPGSYVLYSTLGTSPLPWPLNAGSVGCFLILRQSPFSGLTWQLALGFCDPNKMARAWVQAGISCSCTVFQAPPPLPWPFSVGRG